MKSLLDLLRKSLSEFFKAPILVALGLVFFLLLTAFSKLGARLAPLFQTSFENYAWLIFSVILFLIFGGLISTMLIHFSQKSITKKPKPLLTTIKKSWHRNFLSLWMFLIFSNIINLILLLFTKIMLLLKPSISLSIETFRLLSILLSFFFVAGVVIFFTFTAFFIVLYDLTFLSGIRRSFRFVKQEYIRSLLLTVIFYAIITLINNLESIYADIFNYAILLPFMFFILTMFVLEFEHIDASLPVKVLNSKVNHKVKK